MTSHAVKEVPAEPRISVHDCRQLDISILTRRHQPFFHGWHGKDELKWVDAETGKVTAAIGYEVNTEDRQKQCVRLFYAITREDGEKTCIDYQIALQTIHPHFGGKRWWFRCPRKDCNRRVKILYLPPGEHYFLCRVCHELMYK